MKPIHLAGTSLVALLLGTAVQADVTPDQVWADWQASGKRWGQEITAAGTERQGEDLVVTGVRIRQDQNGTQIDGTLDRVVLADQGDGTVLVTMSERYPLTVTTTPPATDETPAPAPVTSDVVLTQEGLRMIASGEPSDVRYDFTADRVVTTLDNVTDAEGADVPMSMMLTMRGVEGYWEGQGEIDSVTRSDDVEMTFKGSSPDTQSTFDYAMKDVAITANGTPAGIPGTPGFVGQSNFAYATSTYRLDVTGPKTLLAEGESGVGTLNVDTSATSMSSDNEVQDVTLRLSGTQVPFPMDFRMAGMTGSGTAPVDQQAGPFDIRLDLRDVTASDDTWARFDPQGALPRDPAQLSLSLKGDAGEVPTITLESLRLSVVGAELTGKGQMTPTPEAVGPMAAMGRGRVDLTLRGGNALIDKLVQGRILPAQQEMAARMTMGAFGRAVPGEADTITSAIQFGNGITVNGIPLQ